MVSTLFAISCLFHRLLVIVIVALAANPEPCDG